MDAIVSDQPGSFAWGVWNKRHPVLIKQIQDAFPYPAEIRRALDALLDETLSGTIQPLRGRPRHGLWQAWDRGWYGGRGSARRSCGRSRSSTGGCWRPSGTSGRGRGVAWTCSRQPKQAELGTSAVAVELAALDDVARLPLPDQRRALLLAALWGNRADLGFRITAAAEGPATDLLADDSAQIWELLGAASEPAVHLVADNAGRELLADLVLVDHLLATGAAARVVLHVKPQPYYVSDAGGADVVEVVRRISVEPGASARTGRRLWTALSDGTITLRTHPFWCAPCPSTTCPRTWRTSCLKRPWPS